MAKGFTLIELVITLAVMGLLFGIAVPIYESFTEKAEQSNAVADLGNLQMSIAYFWAANLALPDSLAEVNPDTTTDPWGNEYRYLRIEGNPAATTGKVRKDKNLTPINTDYDLYSFGPDGQSVLALTAKKSRDDIVRAGNGSFTGIAENY